VESSRQGFGRKVTAVAWAPNGRRLAVVTVDRVVLLFDENGERKDKFATKAKTKGDKDYVVRALAFSPDSAHLAVAQSDEIVFVYKIGLEWTDKKSIRHKFVQATAVTCMTWPSAHPHEVVFGLADGKVKVGQLRSNKPATLYTTDSHVISCCSSIDGQAILTGHLDGSIYFFDFESGYRKFSHHPCPPYALAWGVSIMAAGSDRRVVFYRQDGVEQRSFDYGEDTDAIYARVKEFTVAASNPSGQGVVVGNFDSFYTFSYSSIRKSWEETNPTVIPNYCSVSALGWKADGSQIAVGTVCGCTDLFDACIKRIRYNGTFELTYVSPSQVLVKRLRDGRLTMVQSNLEKEVEKINIYAEDRYVIAQSIDTLICGDLESGKMSEVPWNYSGTEKFIFDNPSICMIFSPGELAIVEYGKSEILSSCRTEHVRSTLVSVRINERPPRVVDGVAAINNAEPAAASIPTMATFSPREGYETKHDEFAASSPPERRDNKKIAYLLDQLTIRVEDLMTGYIDATVNHIAKFDWLELNARGDLLLFRDRKRQLHLYNVHKQTKTTLLTYCSYVQWVPGSDVVVAQSRGNLCIWYNVDAPDKVTTIPIQGEVEEIQRIDGVTEVRVDEGMNETTFKLDEALIGFGSAIEDGNLDEAMRVLEAQTRHNPSSSGEMRAETEAMWRQLSEVAQTRNRLEIAERCFAAIGDVSMARYMRKVNKIKMKVRKGSVSDGNNHWAVRARLLLLQGEYRGAELAYLESGGVVEAIEMYQNLHQWDIALKVAEERNYSDTEEMKASYFDFLISSGQEAKAGAIQEADGKYLEAIDLYLQGGRPGKAVHVVNNYKQKFSPEVLDKIASALTAAGMHDKAGSFYERIGQSERALESYIKGNAYRNAVELARRDFPGEVVRLEEGWGDYLSQSKNHEAAISHYIEANASKKAIEAALKARQWTKAGQLVDSLHASDEEAAFPYYKRIATHFQQSQQLEKAEKFFLLAGCEKEAIQMYTDAGQWDEAHKLATRYMSSEEVSKLYHRQAQTMESRGKFREAEKLLLAVDSVDRAISMYKKARKFDHMIRLVAAYRKDILKETHASLAAQLEIEGNLRQAEEHFVLAGHWPSALNMYTANDKWEEAMRVAKYHGGVAASRKVAYQWAKTLGGEAGAKLLTKLGLVEQAIDYAIEDGAFSDALELAKNSVPARVPDVHLKHALHLEDEERFGEAEKEFINAKKPREAVEMYNHQQDWENAIRVAEKYDPASVPLVFMAQAKHAVEMKQFEDAETFFLKAKKPEYVLHTYQEQGMWEDALRFAKMHLPHKLQEVQRNFKQGGIVSASLHASGQDIVKDVPGGGRRSPSRISSVSTSVIGDGILGALGATMDSAKTFEKNGEFLQAIECYLHIGEQADGEAMPPWSTEDADQMVMAWDRAVRLASKHSKESYNDVVEKVANRLASIGRYNAAGDLFEEVQRHEHAVESYVHARKWDKARKVAEIAPAYQDFVDRAYRDHMRNERNPSELVKMGDHDSAFALYADQGDWERIFAIVDEGHAPMDLASKYAGEMATRVLQDKSVGDVPTEHLDGALAFLAKYGTPAGPQHYAMFCRLTQEILGRLEADCIFDDDEEDDLEGKDTDSPTKSRKKTISYVSTLQNLREVLFNAIRQRSNVRRLESKHEGGAESQLQEMERLLVITHLFLFYHICHSNAMDEMAASILVAMLKLRGDAVPSDKLYYLAGMACRDAGWTGTGFALLNRYLDLTDAIDEGEIGEVEGTEFDGTDIPELHENPLPKSHYLSECAREEIREWILGAAVDSEIKKEPIKMKWLDEIRGQVVDQGPHLVRQFDRGALQIEEFLAPIREKLLL